MVELPTYFLVSRIFQCHGLKVEALPMKKLNDNRGIDVDELERRLAEGGHPPPRVIYIIPTHQNPTAQTMPLADRIKLANLCQQHGILLIADEVYHLLDWSDGATPSRFAALNPSADNEEGHCVSVSSFTKIFCPGVRCGWIEGPPLIIDKVAQYGYIQSQGGGAPFVGEVMCTAMSSGVADTVLTDLCAAYKDRADLLCNILEKDPRVEITIRPQGGYFLWIKLPFNSNDFLEFCQDRGINFLPGSRCSPFSPSPAELDNYARLCFADLPTEDMVTGANRLLECVDDYARK